MRRLLLTGTMALGLGLIAVPKATALPVCVTSSTTSCSIDLTVTNIANGVLATGGNYGTVTLTLNGSLIDVVVTMATGYGLHNADFAWNGSNGGTNSVSNVTYTYAGKDPGAPTFTATNYGQMDGFGKFVSGFTGGNGSSSVYTQLTFSVSSTVAFTAVGQLLAGNTTGTSNFFSGQIAPLGYANCTGFVGNTGSTAGTPNTNSGCNPVPDGGATLGLLGLAMLGLGYVKRLIA